ncbi:Haem-binding domain-containing protein [Tenacibaculum sp. MAR_2009_124]|uniref:heme-binding domain-containing protein n=1 Tax=Tenacibaculum sp. MAR_2009_124 TaxID=1250059 RepID=UPI00089966AA|nr:heme-binding domain-containing protein [Tenacibaculum sp. MAR_2009_124]SED15787.1 Haem-binding domain-containing protein [Tenacibaculum sp. MAR_2009_124]
MIKQNNIVRKKYVILILSTILIGIQFYRPQKPIYKKLTPNDIIYSNKPPKEIANLVKNACYDCHSNETKKYWYSNIVPVAWLIDYDIKEGKEKLNFSDWETYPHKKKIETAGNIMFQMYEGKMPLPIYTKLHHKSNLSKAQQNKITEWINSLVK